jgi:hypothetical protein
MEHEGPNTAASGEFQGSLDALFAAVLHATKSSNALYTQHDHGFLASFPEYAGNSRATAEQLKDLLASVMQVWGDSDPFDDDVSADVAVLL